MIKSFNGWKNIKGADEDVCRPRNDPAKTSGADYAYVELLKYNYGYNQDAALINPATGEPTAEREKWVLTMKR